MYFRRIKAMARKEVNHILRDPFTLTMALVVPVFLVTIFGYAINLDIQNVRLAVVDQDSTQDSRIVSQTATNTRYFEEIGGMWEDSPERALSRDKAKAALIIPKEFEEEVVRGERATAQILIDGTDNSIVGTILNYFNGILSATRQKLQPFYVEGGIEIVPRYLFNPEQMSPWFIIPGLSVVILSILSILLTALTVAREWETGSMELLLSTPVRPIEIVLGKIMPYMALGLIGATFVYLSARLIFGIPFVGSHLYFFIGTVLFLCTYLAMGLLISAAARQQQLAMQVALIAGFMPSLLLSGFIFSIQNMPAVFQYFTMLLPVRWYTLISRACYLKDPALMDLMPSFGALTLIAIVLIAAVTKASKGTLEK
jgi:ABC-2 type transport system permease protein